jgi:hypothetical protein
MAGGGGTGAGAMAGSAGGAGKSGSAGSGGRAGTSGSAGSTAQAGHAGTSGAAGMGGTGGTGGKAGATAGAGGGGMGGTAGAAAGAGGTTAINPLLTVNRAGSGTGTVTSTPSGINCGTVCSASFPVGPTITLTASPSTTSTFTGWSGGGCTGTGTCAVTVPAVTSVTATFTALPAPLLRWTFDGSATNTGSVAGYPLVLNGTVTFVAGKVGQAAQFATGAYGVVQGSARAVLGIYPQYTISFWVNASASPNTASSFLDFNNRFTAPYGGIQLAYENATQLILCAASTTNSYLGGSCGIHAAPATGAWHHVIVRYAGTGTGAGQGAPIDVYYDDVLAFSQANDADDNPVFSAGISDALNIGTGGVTLDDVRVYGSVFTVANQCTQIIGGTWNGSACALP